MSAYLFGQILLLIWLCGIVIVAPLAVGASAVLFIDLITGRWKRLLPDAEDKAERAR